MKLDIRLPGVMTITTQNSPPNAASTAGKPAAPGTSFAAMLAKLAAPATGEFPSTTALPASGGAELPTLAAPTLLSELPSAPVNAAETALSPDDPALPLTASALEKLRTDHAQFTEQQTDQLPAQDADQYADAFPQLPATLATLAANEVAGAHKQAAMHADASAAAQSAVAAAPGSVIPATLPSAALEAAAPLQLAQSATAAATAQPRAQQDSQSSKPGSDASAAALPLLPAGSTEASFALADHELAQQTTAARPVNDAAGPAHSALAQLQNSAGASQTGAAGGAAQTLAAPVASQQWQQEFSQQMVSIVQRGEHRVSLHLNPADLGPLVVDLKISEQHALLQFASTHSQVRSALEQALPLLREALAEQGISLGDTHIGSERGDQQTFASRGTADEAGPALPSTAEPADAPVGVTVALPRDGRVNLYV